MRSLFAEGAQHTSGKSGDELVALFGGYSYDGLNAAYYAAYQCVGNGAGILEGILVCSSLVKLKDEP